jgi:hypothetical protein
MRHDLYRHLQEEQGRLQREMADHQRTATIQVYARV